MPQLHRRPGLFRGASTWLPLLTVCLASAASRSHGGLCGTAGDELVAAEVGLQREWVVQVPFDSAGWRLEHVVVGDGLVVAQSGDGGIHAVQTAVTGTGAPRAGTVLWSQRLGTPGGPTTAAGLGTDIVTVARDLDLYALDRQTGRVTWHEPLARPPAFSAVPSGDWVFMPLAAEGILRLPVDPLRNPAAKRPPAAAEAAGSDAAKTGGKGKKGTQPVKAPESLAPLVISAGGKVSFPPQPIDEGVFWCTGGTIVALERKPFGWVRREHVSRATVATQPLVRGRSIFAAFTPGELRRLDLDPPDSQRLRSSWRATLPDRPVGGPLLAIETLVVSLGPSGIAGFSVTSGEPLWRTDIVGTLVAVCADRVWLIDEIGRLTGLDPATGGVRTSLCLGCLSIPVLNSTTERIVLASPGGLLVSLGPAAAAAEPAQKKTAPKKPRAGTAGGGDAEPIQAEPIQAEPIQAEPIQAEPIQADKADADATTDAAAPANPAVSDPAEPGPAPAAADPDATPP